MWFPFRKQVYRSFGLHSASLSQVLLQELALSQSAFVLVSMYFFFFFFSFRFVALGILQGFPGCECSRYFWRSCYSLILTFDLFGVFLGDGSEEWKRAEWQSVEAFMAGGSAWGNCLAVSPRPVHVYTGRSKTLDLILEVLSHLNLFFCLSKVTWALIRIITFLLSPLRIFSRILVASFHSVHMKSRIFPQCPFYLSSSVIFACEALQLALFFHRAVSGGWTTRHPWTPLSVLDRASMRELSQRDWSY